MKKLLLLVITTFLFSCSEHQTVSIPDNVLNEEKMAAVLVDVHLEESSMNITGVSTNKLNLALSDVSMNMDVLKKNNITKKQFDESFRFYSLHPKMLSEVYQIVLNNLSKMQAEVNKK